jgi:aldose 1-epimerase
MVRLVNFKTGEYVTILPLLGGRVHEIVLRAGKKRFSILESPQTASEIVENKHWAGVKLIPFAGRIAGARYEFGGKQYRLRVNSKGRFAIHGFVADKEFRIKKTTAGADHASLVLDYAHDGTTKGYPFKFQVRLMYALSKSVLTCTTEIRNTDSKPIPIGDGWHPYFRTAGSIGKLFLSLPSHSVVEVTPPFKVPTGTVVRGSHKTTIFALDRKEMDSVFDFGEKRRRVTTKLIDPDAGVAIQLWQESGRRHYRYLVVYRPPAGSSVAIEPWTCAPNAFNNGMGLIVLKPGARFRASYGVTLRKHRSAG